MALDDFILPMSRAEIPANVIVSDRDILNHRPQSGDNLFDQRKEMAAQ